jgi:DNA-directed RNA polymerase specialized sigma24 family protein
MVREPNDPLLAALSDAADDDARRRALDDVMTRHVRPTVESVLARHRGVLRPEELDDVGALVMLRLVRKLQSIAAGGGDVIASLSAYAATLTYNAVYDVLRERHAAARAGLTAGDVKDGPGEAQAPVQLARLEQRQRLQTLWSEIRALLPQHRAALLLNLREAGGGNALALFIALGIATIDEVAAAAGLTVERLAEVWNRLPMDDSAIAEILGANRQQVINFRRTARERLARRARDQ